MKIVDVKQTCCGGGENDKDKPWQVSPVKNTHMTISGFEEFFPGAPVP
jgi:hypothetical protein